MIDDEYDEGVNNRDNGGSKKKKMRSKTPRVEMLKY